MKWDDLSRLVCGGVSQLAARSANILFIGFLISRTVCYSSAMAIHSCNLWLHRFSLALCAGLCLFAFGPHSRCESAVSVFDEPSYFVRFWSVNDGTPYNTVLGAERRPDGYLWVVTREGLFRFDGEKFDSFRPVSRDVFPGIVTKAMILDRRGRIWITRECRVIACVDGSNTRIYSVNDGLSDERVYSMAEDGAGDMWVSFFDGSCCRISNGKIQRITVPSGWTGPDLISFTSEPSGKVWFAHGSKLGILRGDRFVTLLTTKSKVEGLASSRRDGIYYCEGYEVRKYNEDGDPSLVGVLPPGKLRALYEDRQMRLWAANSSEMLLSKLFFHDGTGFKQVDVSCSVIMSLSDDDEGNLWVGTRGSGLMQVRSRTIDLINPRLADRGASQDDRPPMIIVQSFCQSADGVCFAVGQYGMFARWKGSIWELMNSERGWPGGAATCVAADPRGGVWIGTNERGLFQWKDGSFMSAGDANLPTNQNIRALLPMSNGDLWIGFERGDNLCRLRDGSVKSFAVPAGQGNVCSMAEDSGGSLWAATSDGLLLRVKDDIILNQTPPSMSVPEPIRCLHATPDGSLWIGYASHGIGCLKEGRFFYFGKEAGLSDDPVSQIISDQRGWLWCGGENGIFRISVADMGSVADGKSSVVNPILSWRAEGLHNLQANYRVWPGPVRSRSGELCMPMTTGLAVIRPERGIENPPPPEVIIERLAVNGVTVAVYDGYNSSVRSNAMAVVDLHETRDSLSIGPGVRQWGAQFNVISFVGQENIRFRYRLKGLNDEWVDAGSQRVAYFSQVPPGEYCFQVTACNNQGIWNESGSTLAFSVLPFFWQTWWFRMFSLIALIGIVGGVVWLEARRNLKRRLDRMEQQRAMERERSRIARDIHDDLGAGLTRIAMLSQPAGTEADKTKVAHEHMGVILKTARALTVAMDEIVWAVNPQHDTIDSLAAYLGKFAQDFLRHAGIRCRLDMPLQLPALSLNAEVRHQVFLVFKEALNNIAKHSQATETTISMSLTPEGFTVMIQDNGLGLPQDFARERVTGGHGLVNMRMRMEDIGGWFEITGTQGSGTIVTLSVDTRG